MSHMKLHNFVPGFWTYNMKTMHILAYSYKKVLCTFNSIVLILLTDLGEFKPWGEKRLYKELPTLGNCFIWIKTFFFFLSSFCFFLLSEKDMEQLPKAEILQNSLAIVKLN